MIDRNEAGEIIFLCDSCSDGYLETGMELFGDAALEAVHRGWVTRKSGNDGWKHTCPACAADG